MWDAFRLAQQAIARASNRVFLDAIGEGKQIDRAQIAEHGIAGFAGHRVAMIEAAAAGAGAGNEEAVECAPSAFIGIEAAIEEIAQEAGALGVSITENMRQSLRDGRAPAMRRRRT